MKPATDFNADNVQAQFEAIISAGNRQVAARCALLAAELAEAAREDERKRLRAGEDERKRLGAGGKQGVSFPASTTSQSIRPEASPVETSSASAPQGKGLREPLLQPDNAESRSDATCIEILRNSFRIRNQMRAFPRSKSGHIHQEPATKEIDTRGAISDELCQRIVMMHKLVKTAVSLWQDRLLDDVPAIKRRATTICGPGSENLAPKSKAKMRFSCASFAGSEASRLLENENEAKAAKSQAQTREETSRLLKLDAGNSRPQSRAESPTRPVPALRQFNGDAPQGLIGSPERTAQTLGDVKTPSPTRSGNGNVLSPKNRKELHEDLGRELAQLAADLRNAQIITEGA